jgi:hypothetical protein
MTEHKFIPHKAKDLNGKLLKKVPTIVKEDDFVKLNILPELKKLAVLFLCQEKLKDMQNSLVPVVQMLEPNTFKKTSKTTCKIEDIQHTLTQSLKTSKIFFAIVEDNSLIKSITFNEENCLVIDQTAYKCEIPYTFDDNDSSIMKICATCRQCESGDHVYNQKHNKKWMTCKHRCIVRYRKVDSFKVDDKNIIHECFSHGGTTYFGLWQNKNHTSKNWCESIEICRHIYFY